MLNHSSCLFDDLKHIRHELAEDPENDECHNEDGPLQECGVDAEVIMKGLWTETNDSFYEQDSSAEKQSIDSRLSLSREGVAVATDHRANRENIAHFTYYEESDHCAMHLHVIKNVEKPNHWSKNTREGSIA